MVGRSLGGSAPVVLIAAVVAPGPWGKWGTGRTGVIWTPEKDQSPFDLMEVDSRYDGEQGRELSDGWAVLSFTHLGDAKAFCVGRANRGAMSLFIEAIRGHGLSISGVRGGA